MWQETDNSLYRQFEFADFDEAFAFMQRVADIARAENHHPRWLNEWNKVEIWLSSHDEGGIITEKDRRMAAAIDQLITK
jgi:4a-hydroxytetrahydrobiopterin dehydratase